MDGLFYFMEYLFTKCELCDGELDGSSCNTCRIVWNNVGRRAAGAEYLGLYMTFENWEEHKKKYPEKYI